MYRNVFRGNLLKVCLWWFGRSRMIADQRLEEIMVTAKLVGRNICR